MIQCPGQKAHSLGGCNFATVHEKTIKFLGFSFLDGYIDLTKFQPNPCGSVGKFSEIWSISHGISPLALSQLNPVLHKKEIIKFKVFTNWPNFTNRLCLLSESFAKMYSLFHSWAFDDVMKLGHLKF